MKTNSTSIEPLEPRIAPAMATLQIVNPLTASYTDVDGDRVTVKVSTGELIAGLFTGAASGAGDQLHSLDLSAAAPDFGDGEGEVRLVEAIGGSIVSGIDSSSGSLTKNASIRAGDDIGSLAVKGSLIGNVGDGTFGNASPVVITARGQAVQGASTDVAIGKITVGGRVEFARILAGYNSGLGASSGDAQIGAVSVGGDWVASNLVAGVFNGTSGNMNFGNSNDGKISGGSFTDAPGIISKIASITIKGAVFGTPAAFSIFDHFGFVAEHIGSFKSADFTATLTAAKDAPIELSPTSGDVTIREIP